MAKTEATLLLRIKESGAKALRKTRQMINDIGRAATVVGTALVGFVGASVKAYRDQELAVNQLNQSMVNQGIFTAELSQKYQNQAAALQKLTTFGDEQIIAAQAQLQQFVGNQEVTEDLTKATLDFAAAQGVDLKVAASLVGKAVGTSTNALQRYGVEIDTSGSKSEKMAQVIAGMTEKFGGQAEAAADGLGALTQMKNAFGDLLEVVGKRVTPAISAAAKALTNFAQDASATQPFIDAIITGFQFIVKAGAGVKFAITTLGETIGTTFGFIAETIADTVAGKFSEISSNVNAFMEQVKEDTITNAQELNEEVRAIDDLFKQEVAIREQDHQNQINLIKSQARAADLENQKKTGKLSLAEKKKRDAEQAKLDQNLLELGVKVNKEKVSNLRGTLGTISSLQQSNNKTLVALGKAAAIADITISTAQGIGKAWAMGPFLGPILAGLVAAAGAVQLAQVAGVQLAEGGIVQSRPGGTLATIGEGGQDEAVIPLDDFGGSFGTTVNLTVNGGLLGDRSTARELAIAIDRELLELRRGNESVAFDQGLA